MSQAIEASGCRMFCSRLNEQHGLTAAISVLAPTSAEQELAVFPGIQTTAIPKQRVQRMRAHYPISGAGLLGPSKTRFKPQCAAHCDPLFIDRLRGAIAARQ